jgi:hypothetical protein
LIVFKRISGVGLALVAHAYNPSYSGSRDQEDHIQNQAKQIVCETLTQKLPSQKRTDRVAQDLGPEFKL